MKTSACFSNNVTSSVPLGGTLSSNYQGTIIVLARSESCIGRRVSRRGTIRGVLERCPGVTSTLLTESGVCGTRGTCITTRRGTNGYFIVTPTISLKYNAVREGLAGLRHVCRLNCTRNERGTTTIGRFVTTTTGRRTTTPPRTRPRGRGRWRSLASCVPLWNRIGGGFDQENFGVNGGRSGAGIVHALSHTGVGCRRHRCRPSTALSKTRVTTVLNRGPRFIFGALMAISGSGLRCIFVVPIRQRLSLGGYTGTINRGDIRVVPRGRLLPLANCIRNNYSPVNVGGRFGAITRSSTLSNRAVVFSTNGINERIVVGARSFGGTIPKVTFTSLVGR